MSPLALPPPRIGSSAAISAQFTLVVRSVARFDDERRQTVQALEPRSPRTAARGLTVGDVVVGISASGRTPYVIAAILEARRRSALSVSVACNPDSAAGREADVTVDVVVGPEFIAGSTRLKAGTAQTLVLNMLTTLAMVRSHKTYGNRMVDVRATNAKLVARTFSLVQDVTGTASAEVQAALDASDGEVKTAIAVILTAAPAVDVRARLDAAVGSLRAVL
ncbi:N-acetylmuramic acid 6-phosphate etherase [Curtobacterium herbarum]|uniref:N-acetylmuramic acid 6-phosphate etherase n=1 Tax=Curtobacterium herbarum TaxID=150122 RepID=UPI002646978D|nr:N-acetylmuramic acid 6-phosphate etherase [Curtobacterium herbarum]